MAAVVDEEWRQVEDRPGYEVSNLGRVRSYRGQGTSGIKHQEPHILTVFKRQGYACVNLGRDQPRAIHRLVAQAFLGSPPESLECRHLDGNRMNPTLENLAYGTKAENYNDRRGHGTDVSGERHGNAKFTNDQVIEMRRSGQSVEELARLHNVSKVTIYKILRGETWTHLPGTPTPVRGRLRGDRNPRAVLTEEQIITIRTSSELTSVLARRLGVTATNINAIRTRKTWKHVS